MRRPPAAAVSPPPPTAQTCAASVPQRVPPNGTVRLTREELGFPLPAEGEVGLFNGLTVAGALDVLFYGALPEGQHYARSPEAPNPWEIR
jgi:spore coat protein H